MNPNTPTSSDEGNINSSSLRESIEEKSGSKVIEAFKTQKPQILVEGLDIEVGREDIILFQDQFGDLLKTTDTVSQKNLPRNILYELTYTWKYLKEKFEKSRGKFESIGISPEDVSFACMERLMQQIIEASKSGRKFINGRVASLLKFRDNTLYLQEIPYYSFACSNVSLDEVKIGERSLRDIANLCSNTTDKGEFMLPNSLGVCISVMSKDEDGKPCIIAQDRNNATTLTQREAGKVVASASGAININSGRTSIKEAAQEEVQEELGLVSDVHELSDGVRKTARDLDPVTRELGVSHHDCDIELKGLVMETKRLNPEIVCVGHTSKSLSEIQALWEKAESQYESLSIRGIPIEEIQENLSGKKETLGKHFFMSLLAWQM